MSRKQVMPLLSAVLPLLFLLAAGCAAQKSDSLDSAELAPPPPAASSESEIADTAPEPPPAPAEQPSTPSPRPQRTRPAQPVSAFDEERPRPTTPRQPAAVSVSIPAGTALSVNLNEPLSSETALPGDPVRATLAAPVIVGDRVAFPAGSVVEGKVSDVKSAKKGFKDTGGAVSLRFDRITAPDGHSASIGAGFTKVATGSAGKKAGIIGGSAVGGAILGKVLGKDAKGAAVIGGAIGTAVAGSTKGKEAVIQPDEEIKVALESAAVTSLRP